MLSQEAGVEGGREGERETFDSGDGKCSLVKVVHYMTAIQT